MTETASFSEQVARLTIVGTGLLGASIGLGLRDAGYTGTIVGAGRRKVTVERAKALGSLDEATTDLAQAVSNSQMVILATPLGTFSDLLARLAELDHDRLIMTDVGSTKQQVCAEAERMLPEPARFVGSHPMAGGEQHGPNHARADLFATRTCIVTPTPGTAPATVRLVKTLWSMLGMKLLEMSPPEHDRQAATASHVPHAVAALLVQLASRRGALGVAATGFADTTRIASGDPQVWTDIFMSNRREVGTALEVFGGEFKQFAVALAGGDQEQLLQLLRQCKMDRDAWVSQVRGNR